MCVFSSVDQQFPWRKNHSCCGSFKKCVDCHWNESPISCICKDDLFVNQTTMCTVPKHHPAFAQNDIFASQFLVCEQGAAFSPMRLELSEEHVN